MSLQWDGMRGVLPGEAHAEAPTRVSQLRTVAAPFRDTGFTEDEAEAFARFPVVFDVYNPDSKFSKRKAGAPVFRLAVLKTRAGPPAAALRAWRRACGDADIKVCYVNADAVMLFDAWATQLLVPTMPPPENPEAEALERQKEKKVRCVRVGCRGARACLTTLCHLGPVPRTAQAEGGEVRAAKGARGEACEGEGARGAEGRRGRRRRQRGQRCRRSWQRRRHGYV